MYRVWPEVDRIQVSYPVHLLAMFDEGVGGKPEPLVATAVGTRSAGKQP
jgi:hypothetical protein